MKVVVVMNETGQPVAVMSKKAYNKSDLDTVVGLTAWNFELDDLNGKSVRTCWLISGDAYEAEPIKKLCESGFIQNSGFGNYTVQAKTLDEAKERLKNRKE